MFSNWSYKAIKYQIRVTGCYLSYFFLNKLHFFSRFTVQKINNNFFMNISVCSCLLCWTYDVVWLAVVLISVVVDSPGRWIWVRTGWWAGWWSREGNTATATSSWRGSRWATAWTETTGPWSRRRTPPSPRLVPSHRTSDFRPQPCFYFLS